MNTTLDDACKALRHAMVLSGSMDSNDVQKKQKIYNKGKTLLVVRGSKK
jgi:hypothetical protein